MVQEYTERFYLPTAGRFRQLAANGMSGVRALAAWKVRVRKNWAQIRIEAVDTGPMRELRVGDEVHVRTSVHLGNLRPEDLLVELYMGRVNANGEIVEAEATPLAPVGEDEGGSCSFEASVIPCRRSGLHGYTVRVLPYHPELVTPFLPGLIIWAGPEARAS
jgi:starch phosphorylase